jgi:hypothetical protein
MRLNRAVCNLNGVLLLKAGEILTEKHLGIFKKWGIREADVALADGSEPEEIAETALPQQTLEEVEAEMARRFRRVNVKADPFMAELFRIARARLCRRITNPQGQTPRTSPGVV